MKRTASLMGAVVAGALCSVAAATPSSYVPMDVTFGFHWRAARHPANQGLGAPYSPYPPGAQYLTACVGIDSDGLKNPLNDETDIAGGAPNRNVSSGDLTEEWEFEDERVFCVETKSYYTVRGPIDVELTDSTGGVHTVTIPVEGAISGGESQVQNITNVLFDATDPIWGPDGGPYIKKIRATHTAQASRRGTAHNAGAFVVLVAKAEPIVNLAGEEPTGAGGALVEVDDELEVDPGVLLVSMKTQVLVKDPKVYDGTYEINWTNPSGDKRIELKEVGAGGGFGGPPVSGSYASSSGWPVRYDVKVKLTGGAKLEPTDTVLLTLSSSESDATDEVKLVPMKIDLDIDADYDGAISTDDPDDSAEMDPGGLVAVTNSSPPYREKIILREVETSADWDGDVEILVQGAAAKIKLYDAQTGGSVVASGTTYAQSALPKSLWIQGEEASDTAGDIEIVLKAEDLDIADTNTVTVIETDLDVDADYDGAISVDAPDDPIEVTEGGLVTVTNAACTNRTKLVIRQVKPTDWDGDIRLTYTTAKIKLFDAVSGGSEILNDTVIANSDLPKNIWAAGQSTSDAKRDVDVVVTTDYYDRCADTNKLSVVKIVLHPQASDFAAGKAGRVMISTKHDDAYYTTVETTKADKVAQTEDRKVTVTAHLTPDTVGEDIKVYFRVYDPDPDDRSPYEADSARGDNRGAPAAGSVSPADNVAEIKTINGSSVAAAETVLTFTDRYSGDNYMVECALDSGFSSVCGTTAVMVAWKRIYLEQDRMYKKGCTVTAAFAPDADAADDVLTVDNTSDIGVGDGITIWTSGGSSTNCTVVAKTATSLTVPDLGFALPQYSGVRPTADASTYSAGLGLLEQAYGGDTPGTDGGCFVEFEDSASGGGNVPKYTQFPSNDLDATSFAFCGHWFGNSGACENLFQLVAAAGHEDGSFGTTRHAANICFITTDNFAFPSNAAAIAETVVHELAHQFEVANGHVDGPATANHEGTDECVMSYARDRDNSIAEFDTDCIYDIRDATDPR